MAFSFLGPMKNMMKNIPKAIPKALPGGGAGHAESNQAKLDQMQADEAAVEGSWLSDLEDQVVFDGNGVDERNLPDASLFDWFTD